MQTVSNGVGDVRRLADAQWAAARLAETYQGLPEGVSKAMLLDRFERAAPRLGYGDGLVRLIRALVRVTAEQDWTGRTHPLAWPSNDALCEELQRSRSCVQGLIRLAVRAGLVHMKDSGNGKRWGYRDERGHIVEAFGFDLAPMAARWDEFADLAAARGLEQAQRRHLKRKLGEIRREIRTVCADAVHRGFTTYDWAGAVDQALGRLPRTPSLGELEALHETFQALLAAVDAAWVKARKSIQNEPRGVVDEAQKEPTTQPRSAGATYSSPRKEVVEPSARSARRAAEADPAMVEAAISQEVIPLSLVLEAVPELDDFLADPSAAQWEDLVDAVGRAALLMGINLSAVREAREAMGRNRAAIALATVLARWKDGEIRSSAGGYLRAMCERERFGGLKLLPSLYGLKDRLAKAPPRAPSSRRD
ncbi:plasmid replication protein RepC [Caulobacter sp. CCNWLY153]|uniref:Replication protein C n=1 Tax=Caulobacter radicis TaxID=2172650 RepID=A0A2T9JIN2_9CAUL|nr:plasmid replication protein RepC [Caulobacter radicis]PVM79388.1 replication protein C [Caulobacter radicis]PVM83552.1 replication protein C [Caulobacter radicis]